MPFVIRAVLLFVVVLVVSACGNSGSTATSSAGEPLNDATARTSASAGGVSTTLPGFEDAQPAPSESAEAIYGPTAAGDELTLMSFNLRWDNPDDVLSWSDRLPAIVTMLNEKRPIVLGVQEALAHQVDDLDTALADYDWVGVGRDDGVAAGEFAAIFFRRDAMELVDTANFWLSETPEVPSRGWDAALERIVTWAELRPTGSDQALFVFNTHFDHEGVLARANSAELLAERVGLIAGRQQAVVMGDLNELPESSSLGPLRALLSDARVGAPITDDVGSFNAFLSATGLWNIDYIFHQGGEAIRFETIDDNYGIDFISDHFPIEAVVRF